MKNLRRLYAAFAGKKTTEDGRTLIDKDYDMSDNKAHQAFAGNDRPELHQTLEEEYQTCVEKGVTNLIADGQAQQADDNQTDWAYTGDTQTLNYDTVFGKNVGRYQRSDVVSPADLVRTADLSIPDPIPTAGRVMNYSVMIRNNGGISNLKLRIFEVGGAKGSFSSGKEITITGDFALYEISHTIIEDDRTDLRFYISAGEAGDADFVAGLHMPIESAYPVLFTEGIRPAPLVRYDNFLPIDGWIGGWVSIPRISNDSSVIADNQGDIGTQRSLFHLNDTTFVVRIYGTNGGDIAQENPFTVDDFSRFNLGWLISWDAEDMYLYVSDTSGNMYKYTSKNDINDTSVRWFASGGATPRSTRVYNMLSGTEAILNNTELAKQTLADMSIGSINLKASDIVHQNP